ncbi:hypothetical protein EJP82_01160 [Paenibacillus anaericanus]|uniref:Uncharacterized protein n=1 Tax=Paenibacillus anaericanus TaxID=170367 RepID=A0A3S1KC21_9BACL|nr:hypothetical protein [Paenibacillus anaericanus]RUT48579.1 hypothetical protein EJP82_01160 [Paenibacillus anaericanus]
MMLLGVSTVPIIQFLAAGAVSHVIERNIERTGHGGRVIYVRIASTIVYISIGLYHFWDAMKLLGHLMGVHVYF